MKNYEEYWLGDVTNETAVAFYEINDGYVHRYLDQNANDQGKIVVSETKPNANPKSKPYSNPKFYA